MGAAWGRGGNTTLDAQGRLAEEGGLSRELSDRKEPATGSSGRKDEQTEAKYHKVLEVETAQVVVGRLRSGREILNLNKQKRQEGAIEFGEHRVRERMRNQ